MTTSIINCLSRLYEYIDINSKYYSPLFWVAISLVQIHDQKIFTSAVTLLESIIHTMFEHNSYKGSFLSFPFELLFFLKIFICIIKLLQ